MSFQPSGIPLASGVHAFRPCLGTPSPLTPFWLHSEFHHHFTPCSLTLLWLQNESQHQFYHDTNDGYLVLSVDDDPINQMVVENLLSTEGYKVRILHKVWTYLLSTERYTIEVSSIHQYVWALHSLRCEYTTF